MPWHVPVFSSFQPEQCIDTNTSFNHFWFPLLLCRGGGDVLLSWKNCPVIITFILLQLHRKWYQSAHFHLKKTGKKVISLYGNLVFSLRGEAALFYNRLNVFLLWRSKLLSFPKSFIGNNFISLFDMKIWSRFLFIISQISEIGWFYCLSLMFLIYNLSLCQICTHVLYMIF